MKGKNNLRLVLLEVFLFMVILLGGVLLLSSDNQLTGAVIGLEEEINTESSLGILAVPVAGNVTINSSSNTNKTTENLTLYWDITDSDGDNISNITNWYLNGVNTLVLNMPFENASGNQSGDYSGFENNATTTNATWNSTGGYDGKGAYEFDGENNFIIVDDNSSVDLSNEITVEAWAKMNSVASLTIASKFHASVTLRSWELKTHSTNGAMFVVSHDGTDWPYAVGAASDAIVANTWYHFAGTFDGTNIKVYINGSLISTTEDAGAIYSSSNNVCIGSVNIGCTGGRFNGTIDSVRVWNRSLSADQIYALYINRTDLLSSDETSAGNNWSGCITPNDGTKDGTTVCSKNLTILSSDLNTNLVSPDNYTWTTDTTPDFKFNFTNEDSSSSSCEVFVDGETVAINSTTLENTLTTLAPSTALSLGNHTWGVNCTGTGVSNMSESNYTFDIVEKPTITTPANNTLISDVSVNSTDFTFNFTSNLIADSGTNYASCELFMTNYSGDIALGVNTTTPNGTSTTVQNNQTLCSGFMDYFVNCTYNGSIVTSGMGSIISAETSCFNKFNATAVDDGSTLYPEDFGAVGDGVTDDSDALNDVLANSSETGNIVRFREGKWYRTTKNVLIWGDGKIQGESRDNCGIILDADLNVSVGVNYNAYWFNIGIENLPNLTISTPGTSNAWSGFMKGFTLRATNNSVSPGTTVHLIQFHRADNNWVFEDIYIDMTGIPPEGLVTSMVSQLDGNWASTPLVRNGLINHTRQVMGRTNTTGGGALMNMVAIKNVHIIDNYLWGSGDDILVLLGNSEGCILEHNTGYSIHGRMGVLGGKNNLIIGNYHERIIGANGEWANSQLFICGNPLSGSTVSPVPTNNLCIANIGYLSNGNTGTQNIMDLSGGRNIVAQNNIMKSDCATCGNVLGIRVGTFHAETAYGTWTDPDGLDTDGIAKPREILVDNNTCLGSSPGSIEEGAVLGSHLIGQLIYSNNIARSYNIFGSNSDNETNNIVDTSLDNTSVDCTDLNYCRDPYCLVSICSDSVQTICETGIDCGGLCSDKCPCDQSCKVNSDCITDNCTSGTCQANSSGCPTPETISVTLNTTSINNYTTDDLICYANLSDNDTNSIYANYTWYLNGAVNLSGQSTTTFSVGNLVNIANLSSGNTSVNDNWSCQVQAYDGTLYEVSWTESNNVTIEVTPSLTTTPPSTGSARFPSSAPSDAISGIVVRKWFDAIQKNQPVTVIPPNPEIIRRVEFQTMIDLSSQKIDIDRVTIAPASSDKIFHSFFKIDAEEISRNLEEAKIHFRVENSWLAEKKITPDEIALFHWDGFVWNELPSQLESSDSKYYHYVSITDSFSYFAIGVKEKEVIEEPAEEKSEEGEERGKPSKRVIEEELTLPPKQEEVVEVVILERVKEKISQINPLWAIIPLIVVVLSSLIYLLVRQLKKRKIQRILREQHTKTKRKFRESLFEIEEARKTTIRKTKYSIIGFFVLVSSFYKFIVKNIINGIAGSIVLVVSFFKLVVRKLIKISDKTLFCIFLPIKQLKSIFKKSIHQRRQAKIDFYYKEFSGIKTETETILDYREKVGRTLKDLEKWLSQRKITPVIYRERKNKLLELNFVYIHHLNQMKARENSIKRILRTKTNKQLDQNKIIQKVHEERKKKLLKLDDKYSIYLRQMKKRTEFLKKEIELKNR